MGGIVPNGQPWIRIGEYIYSKNEWGEVICRTKEEKLICCMYIKPTVNLFDRCINLEKRLKEINALLNEKSEDEEIEIKDTFRGIKVNAITIAYDICSPSCGFNDCDQHCLLFHQNFVNGKRLQECIDKEIAGKEDKC